MTEPEKTRLLVAPDDSEVSRQLMRDLEGVDEVWLETFPSFDAAVRSCRYLDPPEAALTVVSQQVPGILELMAALNSSSPTVPLFAVIQGDLEPSQILNTSPSLTLLSADHPVKELIEQVTSTISAASTTASPRRAIDFLLAASLSKRSIALDLTVALGIKIHIEFVGGDIWNAYAGDLENLEALAAILLQPAEDSQVHALHAIPGERQMIHTGLETLTLALEVAQRPLRTGARPQELESVETLDADIASVRAEFLTDKELSPSPTVKGEASAQDPFDTLLAKGIQAALSRDYQRAVESFQKALVLRPGDTRAEFNLGRVQRQIGG